MKKTADLNLLIVEDDEFVARMEKRTLTKHFKSITIVPDAQSGIDEINTGNYDVVLSDWDCPNGGGNRITLESSLPVVVYTGNSEIRSNSKFKVLSKPSDTHVICQALIDAYHTKANQ